jgi:hypothetical protein
LLLRSMTPGAPATPRQPTPASAAKGTRARQVAYRRPAATARRLPPTAV